MSPRTRGDFWTLDVLKEEAPAVLAADGPEHQDEPETHASLSVIRNSTNEA